MLVLMVENAQESLRGELTRWLIEPKAGVFIGQVTSVVRRQLWKRVTRDISPAAGAILFYSCPGEQGFRIETWGITRRRIRDFHGLQLVQRDHPDTERAQRKLNAKPPDGLPIKPF